MAAETTEDLRRAIALLRQRERSAARHLVRAEDAALACLQAAHARAVERVVAQAAVDPNGDDASRASRAVAHVRWAMPGMLTALATATAAAQEDARKAARDELANHVHPSALGVKAAEDGSARAYAAAAALVSAWGSLSLVKIRAWSGARPLAAELAETAKLMVPRIRRAAATEVVYAFNSQRSEAFALHADVVEAVPAAARAPALPRAPERLPPPPPPPPAGRGPYREPAPGAPPPPPPAERLVKVWSALLDRRVCPTCAAMHGTVVLARDMFPGGDPPRHPFCRCVPVIILSAAPVAEISAAYLLAA